jgi:hypothetical protein
MAPVDLASIGPRSNACLEVFNHLCLLLRESPEKGTNFGISFTNIYNELARFKIWGGNIGAFQPTESAVSLAQRLKNAPRAAGQVIKLLKDMEDTLLDSELCIVTRGILEIDRVSSPINPLRRACKQDLSNPRRQGHGSARGPVRPFQKYRRINQRPGARNF